jgi:hypothetical protein
MTREEIVTNIQRKLYDVNNGQSERDFFDDLVELYKLDPTDSITTRMFSKAYENGHAYGHHEVLCHFGDLVEVFKGE